jgi:hypothetical protein
MKLSEVLQITFIFTMIFEVLFALQSNDLSIISAHFQHYINSLSPTSIYGNILNILGNWSFSYGVYPAQFTINFNFMRNFIAYLIFIPYFLAEVIYVLLSVIYYLFVFLYYPFSLLPKPFGTLLSAGLTGIIVISIITEIRIMASGLGAGGE